MTLVTNRQATVLGRRQVLRRNCDGSRSRLCANCLEADAVLNADLPWFCSSACEEAWLLRWRLGCIDEASA